MKDAPYRRLIPQGLVSRSIDYGPRSDELASITRTSVGVRVPAECLASSHVQLGCTTSYCLCIALDRRRSTLPGKPTIGYGLLSWTAHPSTSRSVGRVAPGRRSVVVCVCVDSQRSPHSLHLTRCHLTLPACRYQKLVARSKRRRQSLSSPCAPRLRTTHALPDAHCAQAGLPKQPRTVPISWRAAQYTTSRAPTARTPLRHPRRKCPREVSHPPWTIKSHPQTYPCPPWTRRPRSNHHLRPRRAAAATSTKPACTQ